VSGTAVWTLEGRLVRIDADALADGTGEAPAWSRTPSMPSAVSNLPETAPSPPRLGLAALVGLVPEHETSGSPDGAKGGT
jgi:hypothetical protein